ncbi:Thiol-disulfide isomerase or thioredoxin [Granulicella rosea]|uniref:Thiol-disulfide isomerase or thioredoxin n=1 Tax=Granulicella rosea TaxID=474952 RepID=A0A239KPG8_9BACT|nr:redoxin domain-containing protein [Granulicella rosea]SNT20277.1 Thiol-disulfide isomerase or thioredoxin [Granulicella rosea]
MNRRALRLVTLCLCLTVSPVFIPRIHAQTPAAAAPSAEDDPKFVAAMANAKKLAHERDYEGALGSYQKANKIAGGACKKCLTEVYNLQMGLQKYKDAVASANQIVAFAANPREKSLAEVNLSNALLRQGGEKPKPAQLEAAHAVLQTALTDNPKNISARYSDACVLARMGKMDDAKEGFSACAAAASDKDPMKIRAQHFAENPALSMSKMAPAFTVTALDGSRFTLDEMGGRVVLIDFWATWCGPCNEELPHMKKIAKEFAGQPLVIISISWDSDEKKWKDFINKQEMTWVQYRDADHKLTDMFGIHSIPHYFTIDSDGVLTTEMVGSGSDVEGKLKKLIKRANESKAATKEVASLQ